MRGLKLINPEARKKALESHLLQMRGLKRDYIIPATGARVVASFTDAWIETNPDILIALSEEVASFTDAWIETPILSIKSTILKSHLLQMRGLKQIERMGLYSKWVASFTDAWIETYRRIYRRQVGICRIFYRCVD